MSTIVIVDTREQEPYSFPAPQFIVERRALPAGDYSLAGLETQIAIERKTIDDFVNTVIHNKERFRAELRKLADYDRACVVVEAGFDDLLAGVYNSGAHPHAAAGAALSIIVDYGIPVFFCADRPHACFFVRDYLLRCAAKMRRENERSNPNP